MRKKAILLTLVLVVLTNYSFAQFTEINNLKTKYINWLNGEGANYSRSEVSSRYNKYISTSGNTGFNRAKTYATALDLANPGPTWNIVDDNTDIAALRTLAETNLPFLVFPYCMKGPIVNGNPSNVNYHDPKLLALIIKSFDYLQAKGISSKSNFDLINVDEEEIVDMSSSVVLRMGAYSTAVLMMENELKAANKFDYHFEIVGKMTEFLDPGYGVLKFTYPGSNTDMIRSLAQQRLCYILAEEDSQDKLNDMDFLKSYLDNAMKISNGWADCIKPDLMTFHHRGVYSTSYGGEAINVFSILNLMLKNSPYELSADAQDLLKKTTLNYTKFSNGFELSRGLTGRFPNGTTGIKNIMYAMALQYAADPIANQSLGKEFRRLWDSASASEQLGITSDVGISIQVTAVIGASQNMVKTLDGVPTGTGSTEVQGSFGFPFAGLSAHKYDGAMVCVKGTSKHVWHYESSSTENLYGRYVSAGSMEILIGSPVSRASSGLGVNGWDWSHLPGTTVAYLTPDQMVGSARIFTPKNFLVQASFDNTSGVFAIDYKDANSPTGMTAFKTNFFYKDKVLCLGTGINDVNGTKSIHTTLFQTTLATSSTATTINGTTHNTLSDIFTQSGGGVWATDGVNNGYVIPNSVTNTIDLNIVRSKQIFKDQGGNFITTGDYATAYFNHGTAPLNGSYQYAIAVKGGSAGAKDLYDNFNNYFSVIQQDNKAHVVKFVADNIFNYAVFDVMITFTADVVKSVNKPSVIISQTTNSGNNIKVSLTNPNFGLMPTKTYYTYSQISNTTSIVDAIAQIDPVTLILAGKWKLANESTNVIANIVDNTTEVTFSTINGLTIQTELVANVLPTISLTSPAMNACYDESEHVKITADAVDIDGTISKVEFFQGTIKLGEDLTFPYSFDWINATAGTYVLTAKVTDNNGDVTTSSSINIKINSLKGVFISSPLANSSFISPVTITITADVTENEVAISKVEFFQGTTKLGEDLTFPYSFDWTNATVGIYAITAKVTDSNGTINTSSDVNITVYTPTIDAFQAIGDAYVSEDANADINYPTGNLEVKNGNGVFNRKAFIKFDLSSYNTTKILDNAYLKLTVGTAGATVTSTNWEIFEVTDNSWAETIITSNNQPSIGSLIATVPGQVIGSTVLIPITDILKAKLNGDKIISVRISSTSTMSTANANFISRENSEIEKRPSLVLYSLSTSPSLSLDNEKNIIFLDKSKSLDVKVFPNPSSNEFVLQLPNNIEKPQVRIIDITGRLIKIIPQITEDTVRFGQDLQTGVYLLEVISGNKCSLNKLIKL